MKRKLCLVVFGMLLGAHANAQQVVSSFPTESVVRAMKISGNNLYIANYLSDTVTVKNINNNNSINIPVGDAPWAMLSVGQKVYVANSDGNTLSVLNHNGLISTINVGENPSALVQLNSKIYVANIADNTVSKVDIIWKCIAC